MFAEIGFRLPRAVQPFLYARALRDPPEFPLQEAGQTHPFACGTGLEDAVDLVGNVP